MLENSSETYKYSEGEGLYLLLNYQQQQQQQQNQQHLQSSTLMTTMYTNTSVDFYFSVLYLVKFIVFL